MKCNFFTSSWGGRRTLLYAFTECIYRAGIEQGDCALSTEINLALALENYKGVESVYFETVWGQGHTKAERTGSATDNFISWVEECTK